jgi:PadR family transcriptional regulator PadR
MFYIGAAPMPRPRRTGLLKGTLDLLVLQTLELEPRHGLAIAERIEQITRGTFVVKAGSLFPALHRLEQEGFVVASWGASEAGRRVKTYRLAPSGRRQLARERRQWDRIVFAVGRVLAAEGD